jgi:hypothetical protein
LIIYPTGEFFLDEMCGSFDIFEKPSLTSYICLF